MISNIYIYIHTVRYISYLSLEIMLPFFTLDSDTKAEDAAETLAQQYLPLGCLDYGAECVKAFRWPSR